MEFFQKFGFFIDPECITDSDELVLKKDLKPSLIVPDLSPLGYHIKYGPRYVHPESNGFIIPIQPIYHDMLFPELSQQHTLFEGHFVYGNGILKAYLCHSKSKMLTPGSQIFFYRSQGWQSVQAIGVVERVVFSNDSDEIASFVGKRTVYSSRAIEDMSNKRVQAILFRQAISFRDEITLDTLKENGVVKGPPQSVANIDKGGLEWLRKNILE